MKVQAHHAPDTEPASETEMELVARSVRFYAANFCSQAAVLLRNPHRDPHEADLKLRMASRLCEIAHSRGW